MLKNTILSAGLIAAAGMLAVAGGVGAQTVTAIGSVVSGEPNLDVQVVFTPGTGTLRVQINNLGGIYSDSEAVYGITFSLGNGETLSPSESSGYGYAFYVTPGYGITTPTYDSWTTMLAPTGQPSNNPPWIASQSGQTVNLSIDGSQPDYMVIGPPSGTPAVYTVNSSVTNMNPYLESGATFNLSVSKITAASLVSNVSVVYGTNGSEILASAAVATGGPLPIPATLPLVGGGLLGLGLIALRKRRQLPMQ